MRFARRRTGVRAPGVARHATASHLERIVRAWRRVDRLEDAEAASAAEADRHASRFLGLHPDHDGSWVVRGRLDPEVGAVLEKALAWAREALYQRTSGTAEHRAGDEPIEPRAFAKGEEKRSARFRGDVRSPIRSQSGLRAPALRLWIIGTGDAAFPVAPAGIPMPTTSPNGPMGGDEPGEYPSSLRRHHRAVHEEGFRVDVREGPRANRRTRGETQEGGGAAPDGTGGSEIRFFRPNGETFPAVPEAPAVPADAMAGLVKEHRREGIDPGPWTATPLWQGETLDLGLAVDMLRGLSTG